MGVFHKRNNLDNDKYTTIIAQNTEFKGTINSQHSVQVDGVFDGIVSTETRFIVSETGASFGEVAATEVYVYGKQTGKITAQKVVIGDKGHVNATIYSEHLVILEGGRYVGEKKENTASAATSTNYIEDHRDKVTEE